MGLLHLLVFFTTLFSHWYWDVLWDSRFKCGGRLPLLGDVFLFVALLVMALSIDSVQVMHKDSSFFFFFCTANFLQYISWTVRHIYVAVATKETNTRRAAWSSVEVLSGSLLLSFGALVATFFTFGGDIHYTAIFILLFANVFTPLVFYVWRYLCTPDASKERLNEYQVPINVHLVIHRVNEFLLLMLGETVLQLAVAKWPSTRKHESLLDDLRFNEERKVFTSTFFAGVTIALCQMHVHLCSAPGDDEKHALGAYFVGAVKARPEGMVMVFLYASIFSFKAICVMLVGISIKIALHHPEADGFFSEEQRQFTGSVLAASCAMQLILYPLSVGFKTYCARRGPTPQYATRTWSDGVLGSRDADKPFCSGKQASLTALMLFRVAVLAGMVMLCMAPLQPGTYLGVEAVLSVVYSVALTLEVAVLKGHRLQEATTGISALAKEAAVDLEKSEAWLEDHTHLHLHSHSQSQDHVHSAR